METGGVHMRFALAAGNELVSITMFGMLVMAISAYFKCVSHCVSVVCLLIQRELKGATLKSVRLGL